MEDRIDWAKPFGISLIFHLVVLITLGFAVGKTSGHQPPEEYIAVELMLPSSQQEGSSMLPLTMNTPQSTSATAFKTQSNASAVSSEVASQPGPIIDTGAVTVPVSDGSPPQNHNPKAEAASAASSATSREENRGGNGSSGAGKATGVSVDSVIGAFVSEVERRKEYPYIARKRGQEGVVTVSVALSAGGELDDLKIVQSSGFSQLDDAAMAAIRRACPFYHGLGRGVRMMVPIDYRLL
jgi:protein TonB